MTVYMHMILFFSIFTLVSSGDMLFIITLF